MFKKKLDRRIASVRDYMKDMGIDHLFVSKNENKHFLTGFKSSNYYVIITAKECFLLTDFRYIEEASELAPLYNVKLINDSFSVFDQLKQLEGSVGIEYQNMTVDFYEKMCIKVPNLEFISGDGLVEKVRVIKDEDELETIANAAAIADAGFTYILDYIRPGVTEKEIALKLELFLREQGASGLSFDTICVSGKRSSLPHGEPSHKKIEKGDFVTLDFGCILDGYCSDMTRTVAIGPISQEQRKIYDLVLQAQAAVCDRLKAGISCFDADQIGRNIIEGAGYGEFFGHGLGHGVGMEIHEAPTVSFRSKEILRENMVVTIEPGVYLPKNFGVRIEDLAIIKNSGIINLCKSKKELITI